MRLISLILIFLVFVASHELVRGFTEDNKEQVINGLKGAANLLKFLQEKDFFSMLTKISAVAGPLFSVCSVIMNIAFMFIDIESPEMALMKKEFSKLNNRLDEWSTEFDDIKRKIDWNAVQVSYSDYERSIRAVHNEMSKVFESPAEIRGTQKTLFITKYEATFINVAEKLYMGMINTEMLFSENLFKASQKFTENNRGQVQKFMTGVLQLLIQAIQVQASYVTLKYNSTESTQFVQSIWSKKLTVLKQKMEQIDRETSIAYTKQSEVDIDNLLKKHHGVSNQQFTTISLNFLREKYYWRNWFVVTYNKLSGFNTHTVSECSGFHRFRTNGRNLLVSSKSQSDYTFGNLESEKNRLFDPYNKFVVANHNDLAKFIVDDLRTRSGKSCSTFRHISAVMWGGGVWYWNSGSFLGYRKLCVFNRMLQRHCFNTFLFG